MAMFQDPIAPKPDPAGKKFPKPFSGKPKYDDRNKCFPAGDYYGTGFKAKVGKIRESSVAGGNIPQKSMRKAPESLA